MFFILFIVNHCSLLLLIQNIDTSNKHVINAVIFFHSKFNFSTIKYHISITQLYYNQHHSNNHFITHHVIHSLFHSLKLQKAPYLGVEKIFYAPSKPPSPNLQKLSNFFRPDFHSNSQLAAALSPLQIKLALCNLLCPTPRDG